MTSEQFAKAIRLYVADSVIESTPEILIAPPGRKPATRLVASSQWYNSLDTHNKEQVMIVVARAVHDAIFSFMSVLDGVSIIDEEHSEFQLFCVNPLDGSKTQLSGSEDSDSLHELYKSLDDE